MQGLLLCGWSPINREACSHTLCLGTGGRPSSPEERVARRPRSTCSVAKACLSPSPRRRGRRRCGEVEVRRCRGGLEPHQVGVFSAVYTGSPVSRGSFVEPSLGSHHFGGAACRSPDWCGGFRVLLVLLVLRATARLSFRRQPWSYDDQKTRGTDLGIDAEGLASSARSRDAPACSSACQGRQLAAKSTAGLFLDPSRCRPWPVLVGRDAGAASVRHGSGTSRPTSRERLGLARVGASGLDLMFVRA